jgi:hypothetical protein
VRHSLVSVLAVAAAAVLGGAKSLAAIVESARRYLALHSDAWLSAASVRSTTTRRRALMLAE